VAHWNGVLLQVKISELYDVSDPVLLVVVGILLMFSLLSFTIIFSKLGGFRRARRANQRFLKAFRKSARLDAMAAAVEQFRAAPLTTVFDFGYSDTIFAGGKAKGEIGGLIFRGDCRYPARMAYYADRVGPLSHRLQPDS